MTLACAILASSNMCKCFIPSGHKHRLFSEADGYVDGRTEIIPGLVQYLIPYITKCYQLRTTSTKHTQLRCVKLLHSEILRNMFLELRMAHYKLNLIIEKFYLYSTLYKRLFKGAIQ